MDKMENETSVMTEAEVETCVLDKRGDLWIRTRRHGVVPARNFLVDSKSLSRHSKVFESMLYGKFAESRQESDAEPRWTVELPEDLSTSLKWLFDVMHGKFSSAELSLFCAPPSIFQLAIVADKYDCIELFHPWMYQLRSSFRGMKTTEYAQLCELAWTAYTLGEGGLYETAMTRLITEHANDAARDDALDFPLSCMTVSLRESIVSARRALYDTMLQKVREPLDILINKPDEARYREIITRRESPNVVSVSEGTRTTLFLSNDSRYKDDSNNNNSNVCQHKDTRDCEARMLGKLIQELARAHLWPLPTADKINMSPEELGSKLDGLSCLPQGAGSPLISHVYCKMSTAAESAPNLRTLTNSRLSRNRNNKTLSRYSGKLFSKLVSSYKYEYPAHELAHINTRSRRTTAPDVRIHQFVLKMSDMVLW